MSVAVSVSPISLSVSSPAFSSPSSSSDEDSDSDSLFDRSSTLPSYGEALASPVSSISTSPADSFHFGKTRAAAPLLSPSYSLEDPFFAAPAPIVATNELLAKVFTSSAAVHALPTTSVKVDDLLGGKWEGAVVNDAAAGLRTLYVGGGKLSDLELREAVMDLADRAEEQWGATAVVLALERKSIADLGTPLSLAFPDSGVY